MRLPKLMVYLCVLLAILLYIFLVEFRYKKAESENKEKTSRLLQLEKDSIAEIKIVRSEDEPIRIAKNEANAWRVVSPLDTPADTSTVDRLIASAISAQPEKIVLEKNTDWNTYGLEKPSLSLFFSAKGKTSEISFGASNPSKSSYYVRVQDDPRLFLVADTLEKSLNKSLFNVREKAVVKFSPEEITEIEIIHEGQQTDLKKTEGKWRITHPMDTRANTAIIRSFLTNLKDLKAQEIIDTPSNGNNSNILNESLNKIAFKGRDFSKTLTFGVDRNQTEESKTPGHSLYVSVSGQTPVYVVDGKFFERNKMNIESLRDRSITSFEPIDVQKIEIEFMNKKWLLAKSSDNKWNMQAPDKIDELEDWLVSGLLWSIRDLNFKSEIIPVPEDLSHYHLDNPQLRIWLHQKESSSPTNIRMGWPPLFQDASTKVDSVFASAQSEGSPGANDATRKNEPKTPPTIYAIVEPSFDIPAIYILDGGFVGRLRIDLEQIEKKKK
ncbi:MAG: DUF4340 domain-containing protein [Pseudomonadota bacterium]